MRYTTIIDITEWPEIYRCLSARLIYMHLVLKSGWGERNQDYCRCSIRQLQGDLGLTFAAVRHGLSVLQKWNMIKKAAGGYYVRKYCNPTTPGSRKLTRRQQAAEEQRKREQAEAEIIQRERAAAAAKLERELQEQAAIRAAPLPDFSKFKNLQRMTNNTQKEQKPQNDDKP